MLHAPAYFSVTFSSNHGRRAADRRVSSANPAAAAEWTVERAGRILIAAGAVDEEFVHEVGSEIMAACTIRSRNRLVRTGMVTQMFRPFDSAARDLTVHPLRVVPIGRAFRLAGERALADVHFMSLVSTPAQATIAVGMRMHWPPDGSSADLEVTGAGYHHLPYGRLWLADDLGRRYTVTFDGEGGTEVWRGVLRMSPAPPPRARWLDLVADETNRLIRLDLHQAARRRPRCARTWRSPRPSGCSRWKPKRSWPTPWPAAAGGQASTAGPGPRPVPGRDHQRADRGGPHHRG